MRNFCSLHHKHTHTHHIWNKCDGGNNSHRNAHSRNDNDKINGVLKHGDLSICVYDQTFTPSSNVYALNAARSQSTYQNAPILTLICDCIYIWICVNQKIYKHTIFSECSIPGGQNQQVSRYVHTYRLNGEHKCVSIKLDYLFVCLWLFCCYCTTTKLFGFGCRFVLAILSLTSNWKRLKIIRIKNHHQYARDSYNSPRWSICICNVRKSIGVCIHDEVHDDDGRCVHVGVSICANYLMCFALIARWTPVNRLGNWWCLLCGVWDVAVM